MQKRTKILAAAAIAAIIVVGAFAGLTLADNTQTTISNLQVGNMFLVQSTSGSVLQLSDGYSASNGTYTNATAVNGNLTKLGLGGTLRFSFSLLINITNVDPTNATFRIIAGEMTLGPFGVSQIRGRGIVARFSNDTRIRIVGEGWNVRTGSVHFHFIGHFVSTAKGLTLRLLGLIDTKYDALVTARAALLRCQTVAQPLFA